LIRSRPDPRAPATCSGSPRPRPAPRLLKEGPAAWGTAVPAQARRRPRARPGRALWPGARQCRPADGGGPGTGPGAGLSPHL